MIRAAVLVLTAGLSLAAGNGTKEPLDMEYAKLEGTWQVVSLEVDGMKIPKETIKNSKLIIEGKEFTRHWRASPTQTSSPR
jgi:hypothetical protein